MRSQKLLRIRDEVVNALKVLARELDATIYLFGSYARGDHTLESDVDVVVVSGAFKDMDYASRVELVRVRLPPHIGFDIIPLTPEDFRERLRRAFFKDISRYWIEIKPAKV